MKNEAKNGKWKAWLVIAAVALAVGAVVFCWQRTGAASGDKPSPTSHIAPDPAGQQADKPEGAHVIPAPVKKPAVADDASDDADESSVDEPQTEEEKREAEEERLVGVFDALTDKWTDSAAKGVTMADVETFAKAFRQVPKARRDECVHRALNLIPDENVMLLAGILMDKSMDKATVETVFNDILNRDEDVKKPIMKEIFKDKTHPCWADVAWILDVTGELPKGKE